MGKSCKNQGFCSQLALQVSLSARSTFKKPKQEIRDDGFRECFMFLTESTLIYDLS